MKKTAPLYQSRTVTLPNDTEAFDKHIVSFSEQLGKRNTRSGWLYFLYPILDRKDDAIWQDHARKE